MMHTTMLVLWSLYLVLLGTRAQQLSTPAFGATNNPCPSFNVEVPENTSVGTVLFTFSSTEASNIALAAKENARTTGYLALQQNADQSYEIYLNKSLDLNVLNPRPSPVPTSNEALQCNYSTTAQQSPQSLIRTLEYKMNCDVRYGSSTRVVTSDVIVAIQDINNNAPFFLCPPYYKDVNELTPVRTTVFTLKGLAADLDIDGGIAGYGLNGGEDGYFGLVGGASDGFIVLQKPLDFDYGRTVFALNVTVTDIGDPPQSNWTQLYIQITDGDDLNPAFTKEIYTLALPEMDDGIVNRSISTTPPIHAQDMDKGLNATIRFSLEAGHIHQNITYFSVDPDTGQIIPRHTLSRAIKSQFILTLKAYQADNPQNRFTSATLVVTVEDRNMHAPSFRSSQYNVTIPENAPSGYQVLQLSAIDDDVGNNAVVDYHIIDATGTFIIDSATGALAVQNSNRLDRETQPVFTLTVYAEEAHTYEHYRSNNVTVRVTLLDENDNSPTFIKADPTGTYYFISNKTSQAGTLIGMISATDPDEGVNGQVRYSVLYGSESALARFVLDPVSGALRTRSSLDQPYLPSYALTVQAFDQALTGMRSAVAIVNVTVRADNIHAPVFLSTPYMASLSEASSIGTMVFTLQAQDADSSVLTYSITRGNIGDVFTIQRYSGMISLWRPLDRETKDRYSLTVAVSDNLNRVETELVIEVLDANDNDPVFGQVIYYFEVLEEQAAGLEAGALQASDADLGVNADIRYEIGQDWAKEYFSMDERSGLIRTVRTLDRETQTSYEFLVVGRDRGTPSRSGTATVRVQVMDLNDQAPVFQQARYEVAVLETSEPQVILQVKAVDGDMAPYNEIRYTIVSGKSNMFGIDPLTGRISTKMTADLGPNSPHLPQEVIVVKAYNTRMYYRQNLQNATTTVIVNFVDVNNNRPVFTEPVYRYSVLESTPIGSSLFRVLALDSDLSEDNHQVTYWMESNSPLAQQKFHVERGSGIVRLMQPLNADPPTNDANFIFTVFASDMKISTTSRNIENASATVNISVTDVNDEPPIFEKDFYEVIVSEDTPVGAIILNDLRAHDKDQGRNGQVTYIIQAVDVPFNLDPEGGQLSVKQPLDYDTMGDKAYSLVVIAVDKGQVQLTGTTTVEVYIVNVNDNQPVFLEDEYMFEMTENLPASTLVGQVAATDADRDIIQYLLVSSSNLFRVVNNTGQLFTRIQLDFENASTHILNISARDVYNSSGDAIQGRQSYVKVTVRVTDQNDNNPEFVQSEYRASVEENMENKILLQVSAQDGDSGAAGSITYSIVAGNEQGIFAINASTGHISVVKGHLLNYQLKQLHHLVVQAKDGGKPALTGMTDVVVTVTDANNLPPVFRQASYQAEVAENIPAGFRVIQVLATDEDTNSSITYSLTPDSVPFIISPQTGEIITTEALDREQTASYTVHVTASDSLHMTSAQVVITVTDANDHSPVFSQQHYQKVISPRTQTGEVILTVSASDADEGLNGVVSYWMSGGLGLFDLNPDSGDISVAADLTSRTSEPIVIHVFARDHGYPSFIVNVTLHIYLNGSNAYSPEFTQFLYRADILETSQVGTSVLQLSARDLDSGPEGQVAYDIIDGNIHGAFNIDASGIIRIATALDYEAQKTYEVKVQARDRGSEPKSAVTVVQVYVMDANDNRPLFLPVPDHITMQGPLLQSEPITIVAAADADGPGNNDVRYTLLTWNDRFTLHAVTGELNASTVIQEGSYNLTIQAQDGGSPPLATQLTISLRVLGPGSNTSQALFDKLVYRVTVSENVLVPRLLQDFNARLRGAPNDQGITYNISQTYNTSLFLINATTGELSLIKSLTYSQQATHSLVISAYTSGSPVPSQAVMVVKVQDTNTETPYFDFKQYRAEISESLAVGEQVITLSAHDNDQRSSLHYTITNSDAGRKFGMFTENDRGVVRLTELLDRDTMPPAAAGIYTLQVRVTDGLHESRQVSVFIKVVDVNDNPPSFSSSDYNIFVSEGVGLCQEVYKFSATDADSSDWNKLIYSISAGNDEGKFSMGGETGMLQVSCNGSQHLDRETRDFYVLNITVLDTAGHVDQARVHITVNDTNDNPPHFVGLPSVTTISEGEASLGLKINISATDPDLDSRVTFTFLTDYPEFNISTTKVTPIANGEISVVRALDREAVGLTRQPDGTALYRLTVIATDHGFPALTSSATVTVLISDINDNVPHFDQSAYEMTLAEGTAVGTTVTRVQATDLDLNAALSYSFLSSGPFEMNSSSGEVIVSSALDTTLGEILELQISVTDGLFSSKAFLIVRLVDSNNNEPVFERPLYQFSVSENDMTGQLGTYVGKVAAYDLDLGINGKVTYFITSRNEAFIIDENTGDITVSGIIDREIQALHVLIITAKDGGKPSRKSTCDVEVTIEDMNDNPPEFQGEPYVGQVNEHAPPGTQVLVLGHITAVDRDFGLNSALRYSLVGEGADLFKINQETGVITVGNNSQTLLDREVQRTVRTQVMVKDQQGRYGCLNSTASLLIYLLDINDHPPAFTDSYSFTVSEGTVQYSPLGVVTASDPDGSTSMTYTVVGGGDGRFYVDRVNGTVYLVGSVDYETKAVYHINVSANDNGVTPGPLTAYTMVTISVTDENDNAPVFTDVNRELTVMENQPVGTYISKVNVTDRDSANNSRVTLSLFDAGPFSIDGDTGVIRSTSVLDREAQTSYTLYILASDNGSPVLTGTAIYTVKVIDVNDHDPQFTQDEYVVSIAENSPVGSVMLLSKAVDLDAGDNSKLTYSLSSDSNVHLYFAVDVSNGLISVAKPITKSRWMADGLLHGDNVTMTITATDSGQPPRSGRATVKVQIADITDSSPRFTQSSYYVTVAEDIGPATLVASILATSTDRDLVLTYSFLHPSPFFINQTSGEIKTRTDIALDREFQDFYSLTVKVTDNLISPRSSFALVSVRVSDVNDNDPIFSQPSYNLTVSENMTKLPTVVGQFTASDSDLDLSAKVTYIINAGNNDDTFQLNPDTGVLSVKKPLDREAVNSYLLVIKASDSGAPVRSSTTEVKVTILDANDNKPQFEDHPYFAQVQENGPAGQQVAAVFASDMDIGPSGTVVYELISENVPFYLQTKDGLGLVFTQSGLDYEHCTSYNLSILAHDLGTPVLSTVTYVLINVTDVPDEVPSFDRDTYELFVQDSLAPGSEIFILNAGPGNFTYEILGGNTQQFFLINSTTGGLILLRRLNFQKQKSFELIILAYGVNKRTFSDTTKVNIEVIESQPVPEFPQSSYQARVMENAAAPQLIIDLNTYEEMAGIKVKYFIVDKNFDGLFFVEQDTGKLWISRTVDREESSEFKVTVACQQLMVLPSRSKREIKEYSTAEIIIEVGDVNDNAPWFPYNPVIVGAKVDASFTDPIGKIQVFDADAGNGSSMVFSIVDGADMEYFYIQPQTGVLFPNVNFRVMNRELYTIIINVTDDWGVGFTAQTTVKIVVLRDIHSAVLVAKISPPAFQSQQHALISNLSSLLGWQIQLERLEPHIDVDHKGTPSIDISRTDMYFQAIDTVKERAVPHNEIMKRISAKSKEIEALFGQFLVQEVRAVAVRSQGAIIRPAEIALIAIGCVIFCGALLGICLVCITRSKQGSNKSNQTAPSYATLSRQALHPASPPSSPPNGSLNRVMKRNGTLALGHSLYADNIGFRPDSPDYINGYTSHPDLIDGPTYCMFLPDNNSLSDHSYDDQPGPIQFVSYDKNGRPVLVVDHEPGGSGSSGYGSQHPWTSPYTGDVCNDEDRQEVVADGVIERAAAADFCDYQMQGQEEVLYRGFQQPTLPRHLPADQPYLTPRHPSTSHEYITIRKSRKHSNNDGLNKFEIGETEL